MSNSIKLNNNTYWNAESIVVDDAGTNLTDVITDVSVSGNTSYSGYLFAMDLGNLDTASVSNSSYKTVNISFNITFATAPTVVITGQHAATTYKMGDTSIAITSVSTTGFTARLYNYSEAARSLGFNWVAFGSR